MIKHTLALALTLTAVTLPSVASAATQVQSLNTGEPNKNGPDANWTVTNLTTNVTTQAWVPNTVPSSYNGGAQNPANDARWIFPTNASGHAPGTTFAFTRVFTLSGMTNLASAVLSGKYWSDNGIVSILLNGVAIFGPVSDAAAGGAPTTTFSSANGATIPGGTNSFQYGLNTLVFNVRNGGTAASGNPVALKADIDVAAAVPEPGTWMLMLLGFGAIGFAMRSRAKTQVRFQFA